MGSPEAQRETLGPGSFLDYPPCDAAMMEAVARWLWIAWGEYAKFTDCDECGSTGYCHAAKLRGRWLCLDCFDLSPEADRMLTREVEKSPNAEPQGGNLVNRRVRAFEGKVTRCGR
jgi:hypothetical protein